jgi:hypothetical protein
MPEDPSEFGYSRQTDREAWSGDSKLNDWLDGANSIHFIDQPMDDDLPTGRY